MSWFRFLTKEKKEDLSKGLEKTRRSFWSRLAGLLGSKPRLDASDLEAVEEALISADVGLETTAKLIGRLEQRLSKGNQANASALHALLAEETVRLFPRLEQQTPFTLPEGIRPYVILVVGVNGVGKTTTVGKLAYQYKQQGYSVLLGAADTFRAAAIDQLVIWSQRVDVPLIRREQGSDPASVAYDTVNAAVARKADVVLIDTAGRLHNKVNLMNELSKIRRVIQKVIAEAPHEVLLVLDATTGQNAVEQARQFSEATSVTGLVLTKLDGTAKGGVVLAIADRFGIPVRYVGVGEKVEHLQPFDSEAFAQAMFAQQV
ncbi:MAG: signal recognition particle-docking protein FtsY [Chitinophagales bacterium]|nr:signal recognition particle-docking protein FtsY [Chitinophagales bacterium]MDW8428869.1 signal recognition particle-docking protein FtsY [Chitinophagales bacterium]